MDILALSFLIVASVFFLIFVLISATFIGLWLSEIGLWISWIPISFVIASVYFLIRNYLVPFDTLSVIFIGVSLGLNIFTILRLFVPFIEVNATNTYLKKAMENSLGEDYLDYVDPFISSRFSKNVRFRLSHYFIGVRTKALDKKVGTIKDVVFKKVDNQELKLNIHYPKRSGKFPTIVFIHGGGFVIGSKDVSRSDRICKLLANYGYVVFNVDYRLAPLSFIKKEPSLIEDLIICDMVADIRASIVFASKNAETYNGIPEELFLFGRSAGGHLALITAFSCLGKFLELKDSDGSIKEHEILGVAAFYPVTNFTKLYDYYGKQNLLKYLLYKGAGGTPEEFQYLYQVFSPTSYLSEINCKEIPPVFLATGEKDKLVSPEQSKLLYSKLQTLGIESVMLDLPWANHGFDTVLNGPGGQLALKYLSQFLVWVITKHKLRKIEELAKKRGLGNIVSKEKYRMLHKLKKQNLDKEQDMNQFLPFIEYFYEETDE